MTDAWRKQATCVGLPTEWWFESERTWRTTLAKQLFTDCVRKEPCLAEALANPTTQGVWGGHCFPSARQRLLKIRRVEAG
jgi:hypothetical protein